MSTIESILYLKFHQNVVAVCRTDAVAAAAESARKRTQALRLEGQDGRKEDGGSGGASDESDKPVRGATGSTRIATEFGNVYNAILGSATEQSEAQTAEAMDETAQK